MIISDERFAAAVVTANGDALKFDDVGCLIQHEAGHLRGDAAYWIHDFLGREWLDARRAVFVHSASISSPMGHDLAAVPTAHAAEELKGEPTRVLQFSELPGFLAEGRREAVSDLSRSL
jgi:copper chaperone NosL